MSALEVETLIRSLPPDELRQFAEWWDAHRRDLLNVSAGTTAPAAESDAVKTELLPRRPEYTDHPERFVRLNDAALDQMFRDIENEDAWGGPAGSSDRLASKSDHARFGT